MKYFIRTYFELEVIPGPCYNAKRTTRESKNLELEKTKGIYFTFEEVMYAGKKDIAGRAKERRK